MTSSEIVESCDTFILSFLRFSILFSIVVVSILWRKACYLVVTFYLVFLIKYFD